MSGVRTVVLYHGSQGQQSVPHASSLAYGICQIHLCDYNFGALYKHISHHCAWHSRLKRAEQPEEACV